MPLAGTTALQSAFACYVVLKLADRQAAQATQLFRHPCKLPIVLQDNYTSP